MTQPYRDHRHDMCPCDNEKQCQCYAGGYQNGCAALEAQLTAAIEALEEIMRPYTTGDDEVLRIAREALAKLRAAKEGR